MDAHQTGEVVAIGDLNDQPDRWPAITTTAAELGMTAAAGIPMRTDTTRIGALNLYHRDQRDWTEEDLETARLLAGAATAYVLNTSRLQRAERVAEQLQEALDSRVVIEQAKGVLHVANDISIDAAFTLLRDHARRHQAPLRSVANAVVNLGLRI